MKTAMNATIRTTTKALRTLLPFVLLALPGCFSLSHGAPSQRHYVLGADAPAEREALVEQTAVDTDVIGLRPPRLADYLASPFIVVRRGTHRIGFSEFERWGEELARGMSRTLAGHMAVRSPAHRVESAPWPPGIRPDYLVQLHVLRFEGVAPDDTPATTGEAHLLATWEILDPGDEAILASGTTELRSPGWTVGDFDGLVGLLDAALDSLAEDLVLGLERVPTSPEGAAPR